MEQERVMQAKLEIAEEKVSLLVKEKKRLEAEIQDVASSINDPENRGQINELSQHEETLKEELELINSQIAREMMEVKQVEDAHDSMVAEINEFQSRLSELKGVNARLADDKGQTRQAAVENTSNLAEMRNMIELEAAQRNALESYIKQLKAEVIQLYTPEDAEDIMNREELKVFSV
jgi:chromosome segregation ATPase